MSSTVRTILLALLLPLATCGLQGNSSYSLEGISAQDGASISESAPVGLSLEFYDFPNWIANVSTLQSCVKAVEDASGKPMPIRIGVFDPNANFTIRYAGVEAGTSGSVPTDATFGPKFFELAKVFKGPITMGLQRIRNDLNNTLLATDYATRILKKQLYAVELGNEPDVFNYTQKNAPIFLNQTWTPERDHASEIYWQRTIGDNLNLRNYVQAGLYYFIPRNWTIAALAAAEQQAGALKYVKSFANHAYPQTACGGLPTSLATLQNHSDIVDYVNRRFGFQGEVAAAKQVGKPIHIGEANSASCGGGGISQTFGAALWVMDYVIQSVKLGYTRVHFHQGKRAPSPLRTSLTAGHPGNLGAAGVSPYNFVGPEAVNVPFYGAYFVSLALKDISRIVQLDDGKTLNAAYALYKNGKKPERVLLYNSAIYNDDTLTGRPYQTFTVSGLTGGKVKALRLTANNSQVVLASQVTIGGQSFSTNQCRLPKKKILEEIKVTKGSASVEVGASEAVLIYA